MEVEKRDSIFDVFMENKQELNTWKVIAVSTDPFVEDESSYPNKNKASDTLFRLILDTLYVIEIAEDTIINSNGQYLAKVNFSNVKLFTSVFLERYGSKQEKTYSENMETNHPSSSSVGFVREMNLKKKDVYIDPFILLVVVYFIINVIPINLIHDIKVFTRNNNILWINISISGYTVWLHYNHNTLFVTIMKICY